MAKPSPQAIVTQREEQFNALEPVVNKQAVATSLTTREAFVAQAQDDRNVASGATLRTARSVVLPYFLQHISLFDVDALIHHVIYLQMTPAQAADTVGVPRSDLSMLLAEPSFLNALQAERNVYDSCSNITRRDIVNGLIDAAGVAKTTGDGAAMVSAYTAIAKVTGLNAPTRIDVNSTVSGKVEHTHSFKTMNDAELRKYLVDADDNNIIEGEVI